jgi:hypothetical protein
MKINPKKLIKKIKILPGTLARHSFLTFFIFLLLDFVLAGFVFYKYVILIEKTKAETLRTPLRFDQINYQGVLKQWQTREENLEKINSKQYINPFQEIRIPILATVENNTATVNISGNEEVISPTSTQEAVTTSKEISGGNEEETLAQETNSSKGDLMAKLLFAGNIFDFYRIKKEKFPSVFERAITWEQKGLGKRDDYYGSVYQNMLLLQALKKELTK